MKQNINNVLERHSQWLLTELSKSMGSVQRSVQNMFGLGSVAYRRSAREAVDWSALEERERIDKKFVQSDKVIQDRFCARRGPARRGKCQEDRKSSGQRQTSTCPLTLGSYAVTHPTSPSVISVWSEAQYGRWEDVSPHPRSALPRDLLDAETCLAMLSQT